MAIYGNMVVPSRPGGGALPTSNAGGEIYVPGQGVSGRLSEAGAQAFARAGDIQAGAARIGSQTAEMAMQGVRANGQALGEFARGLKGLGGMFAAIEDRNRRLEIAEAQEAFSRLQTEYIEKQREWSQIKGANTVHMEELKSKWWDEAMPRLTQGLGEYGRRYFNSHADRVGAMADTFIHNHQERETQSFESQQMKLAMDSEANMLALNPFDSGATAQSLGRMRGLIEQEGIRKGWTPEMVEQAFRQAAGTAWGNAMAVQISQGNLDGANRLMAQYGAWLPAEQRAKLNIAWNDGLRQQAAGLAQAGNVTQLRALIQGAGARTLDAALEAGAGATVGQKYTWGENDCSGHTCQIWQAALPDSPAKRQIFGGDGEHRTAAEIMKNASDVTGHLYKGLEINESSVGGGWLLASAGQDHARGRFHNIGHIVTTFRKGDGSVWVSEALGGKTGKVQTLPLSQWLARYKGRALYGVNLSGMQAAQGVLGGGYSAGGRKIFDISAPIAGQIEAEAVRQGVDPAQALVICQIESSGNMGNRTGQYHGLFQLSEDDTRTFGQPGDNRHDQATNIRVGIAQWKRCLQEFGGDPHLACIAYNKGIGGTKAWLRAGGKISDLKQETQDYLKKYDRYMAGLPARQQGAQAQAVKMSPAARETYDAFMAQVNSGAMKREEFMEIASGMAQSQDKDKARQGREILAALQQGRQGAGAPAQGAPAPAMVQGVPAMVQGQGFTVLPQTQSYMQQQMIPTQANALFQQAVAGGGTPEEQELRFMESLNALDPAMKDKIRPYGERWFNDMKQDRNTQGQIQYQQAWELLSRNKTRREQENLFNQLMQSPALNDVAKSKLKARFNEEKQLEKPEGVKWCAEMYAAIDEHWKANAQASSDIDKKIDAAAGSGLITDAQAQKLREWNRTGGSRKNLDDEFLKKTYNQFLGNGDKKKSKWEDVPDELRQRMWNRVKSNGDKPVSRDELKEMMAEEMSVAYAQAPSILGRVLPAAGLVFPGMMTSQKEVRYWETQTTRKGQKITGIVPRPEIYGRIQAEAKEQGYDPDDEREVAEYYLLKLQGKIKKRSK